MLCFLCTLAHDSRVRTQEHELCQRHVRVRDLQYATSGMQPTPSRPVSPGDGSKHFHGGLFRVVRMVAALVLDESFNALALVQRNLQAMPATAQRAHVPL